VKERETQKSRSGPLGERGHITWSDEYFKNGGVKEVTSTLASTFGVGPAFTYICHHRRHGERERTVQHDEVIKGKLTRSWGNK